MVGVADGEGVGKGVVERDVLAIEVGHRGRGLGRDPLVVVAAVERLVSGVPVMVQVIEERQAEVSRVRAEGQHLARAVGLVPDVLAARQPHRARVTEPANAAQGAEVLVERAVLLHQHDDVLDVADRPGAPVCGDRHRTVNAGEQHARRGGAAAKLQESAAVDCAHAVSPSGSP